MLEQLKVLKTSDIILIYVMNRNRQLLISVLRKAQTLCSKTSPFAAFQEYARV